MNLKKILVKISIILIAFVLFSKGRNKATHVQPSANPDPLPATQSDFSNLFGSFVVKGDWWLPSDASIKIPGSLSFEGLSDGLELSLTSPFDHDGAMEDLFYSAPSDDAALWIHGKIDGNCISLCDAIRPSTDSYSVSFSPRIGLIGQSHANADTKYGSATFSFPGLDHFLRFSANGQPVDGPTSVTFTAAKDGIDVELALSNENLANGFSAHITIRTPEPQSIDTYFGLIYSLQYVFSLMLGYAVCPTFIALNSGEQSYGAWYKFQRRELLQQPLSVDLALFYRCMSAAQFIDAIRKWLQLSSQFLHYTYNFLGNFYHPHPKARVNLVFFAQSLERFHGLTRESEIPPDLQAALSSVKKHIKENIDKPLRQPFFDFL